MRLFDNCQRPVILLGNGARDADCAKLLRLGVPVLSSWMAPDLVDNFDPMYFGRPGVYGQRCANRILHEADYVLSVGCRLSIMNVGYAGFREDQRVVMVDVDEAEVRKHPRAEWMNGPAKDVVDMLNEENTFKGNIDWLASCFCWRKVYPWMEPALDNANYISPYRFMERLQAFLRPDEVIVADVGTANVCAQQILRLKPSQRLLSSGGLGEMGNALPGAVGASFARGKGEVLCLSNDGGMMLNLQELQTIVHHQLPIKIIVFSNDGYAMIRRSQEVMGYEIAGVSAASGCSLPSFVKVARSFGLPAQELRTWADFDRIMPSFMAANQPALVEVFTDPRQTFLKLNPIMVDGKPTTPAFWDLSPRVEAKLLTEADIA